jgi:hypothetical protein
MALPVDGIKTLAEHVASGFAKSLEFDRNSVIETAWLPLQAKVHHELLYAEKFAFLGIPNFV